MDLKPCPFCGKHDVDVGWWATTYSIACNDCRFELESDLAEPIYLNDQVKHECIQRWNTRPAEDALRAEMERLREIIRVIDELSPRADHTCDEPGITLSEAARRHIEDKKRKGGA
jgi:Lar family restriction alleviation protein